MARHGHIRHLQSGKTKKKHSHGHGDEDKLGGIDGDSPIFGSPHGVALIKLPAEEPQLPLWERQADVSSQDVLTVSVPTTVDTATLTESTPYLSVSASLSVSLAITVESDTATAPTTAYTSNTSSITTSTTPYTSPWSETPTTTRTSAVPAAYTNPGSSSLASSKATISTTSVPTTFAAGSGASTTIPSISTSSTYSESTTTSANTTFPAFTDTASSTTQSIWYFQSSETSTGTSWTSSTGWGATATVSTQSATSATNSVQSSVNGTDTSGSSSSSSSSTDTESTAKIVGGVVGGVAGIVLLLIAALFLVHRRKSFLRTIQAAGSLSSEHGTAGSVTGQGSIPRSAEMTSRRSSNDPLFAAALSPSFMKRWRQSNQTTLTGSTLGSETSERGFQKISGRKLPSVFQPGSDGYGGGMEVDSPTGTEPSIVVPLSPSQSRTGPYATAPTTNPRGVPLDASYTRESQESDDAIIVIRPSPARTPVASSVNVASPDVAVPARAFPQPQSALIPPVPPMPRRPDGLGRSHPSLDGSRGSRFTESLDI